MVMLSKELIKAKAKCLRFLKTYWSNLLAKSELCKRFSAELILFIYKIKSA